MLQPKVEKAALSISRCNCSSLMGPTSPCGNLGVAGMGVKRKSGGVGVGVDSSVGEGRTAVAGVSASGLCAWSLGSGVASGAEVGVHLAGATVFGLLGVSDVSRLGGIWGAWPGVILGFSVGDDGVVSQAKTDKPPRRVSKTNVRDANRFIQHAIYYGESAELDLGSFSDSRSDFHLIRYSGWRCRPANHY